MSALRRRGYFLLAAVLAITASVVAFQQQPRPDPLSAPLPFTWAWWRHPIETNAIRRLTFISSNIQDITLVPDTKTLWIVGSRGLLASSKDGGLTWEKREINAIMPPSTGVTNNEPLLQKDSTPSPSIAPGPIHPDSSGDLIRQGPAGNLPPSPSPTVTPGPQLDSTNVIVFPDLTAISFYDKEHGAAVGREGAIARTTDGGRTWQFEPSRIYLDFLAVSFDSHRRLVALAKNGDFYKSERSGDLTMMYKSAAPRPSVQSAFLFTTMEAWAWGSNSVLYRVNESSPKWGDWEAKKTVPPFFIPIEGLGHIAWIGPSTKPVKMRMLDRRPADAPTLPDERIKSILFTGNDHDAWAVGDEGIIYATNDAGKSWRPLALTPSLELKKQWQQAGNHSRFPAPWYYVACLVCLGLCVPVLRRSPEIKEQSSVADTLASDRPIEPGEPAPLQFNAVALGLSRFLRNANTTPPLSIAITGEWGTGKSSLMNLLRGDLRARGFRPVWFNPWHHQKEEHLLAALLENIQAQAIPALFSIQGFCYRASLIWFRARRYWRISLFLGVLLAGFAGYFAAEPSRMERVARELRGFTTSIGDFIGDRLKKSEPSKSVKSSAGPDTNSPVAKAAEKPATFTTAALQMLGDVLMPDASRTNPEDQSHGPAALVFVTSLIGAVVALVKSLRSFGVNPSSLLATSSHRPRLRDLKAETSFRYKFARQFADVTRALRAFHRRTMLILIDDLDRCHPDSVVEMLEAVNFLITCGDCFIVIGMARERVEQCVGLAFKDMAEEVFGQGTGTTDQQEEERKRRRAEYAQQYLEKLINIEVPVPEATSEQSRELLARDEEAGVRQRARKLRYTEVRRAALLGMTALFLIGAAFFAGKILFPNRGITAAITTSFSSGEGENVTPSQAPADVRTVPASTSAAATLDSAMPDITSSRVLWPLIALLLAAGVWSELLVPANVVYDSAEFTKALRLWQPIISRKRNTPRSLKRFLNRVRYLAMKQRGAEPVRTRWQAFLAKYFPRLATPEETPTVVDNHIDEGILVGLCACKYLYPDQDIKAARQSVKNVLMGELGDLSDAEESLLNYLKGEFAAPAQLGSAEFEKLHAGLHVY
ncbi:MAG TPA: P-loop NTPase fold protein [Chthoniobacterales bacterium]|nr:P-loop NTPase fold protein [Chthoniobacterales bacterium]